MITMGRIVMRGPISFEARMWAIMAVICIGCALPARQVHQIDNNVSRVLPASELDWVRTGGRIALSPDGKELATISLRRPPGQGYPPGTWQPPTIWSLETRTEKVLLPASASKAVWSHDGNWIATVGRLSEDQPFSVHQWNASTGEQIRSIDIGEMRSAPGLAISPDDSLIAWTSREGPEGTLTVHSLQTGETITISDPKILPARTPGAVPIFISADNSSVYTCNVAWHLETVPRLKLSKRREFSANGIMAVSPDLKHGYAVDYRHAVDIRPTVNTISIFARGNLWSDSDRDHSRKVALYQIDLSSGAISARWDFTHAEHYPQKPTDPQIAMATNVIAMSPDGSRLALGTRNGIHVLDLRSNKDLGWLTYDTTRIDALGRSVAPWANVGQVAFFPDGKRIIGAAGPQVFFWDLP